ncbi:hypothetical protein MP228_009640 [Amoeboaphelidium protococcarum]|nr:hypothetical protein MP228_009640 [Amoeboaphelidium protococcarum]
MDYRRQFDNLKVEYDNALDQLQEVQQLLDKTANEKRQIEEEHENMVAEWKQQLDQKAAEFNQLRRQFAQPVADVSVLRAKYFAEFVQAIKSRDDQYESQTVKYKQLYFQVQQELVDSRRAFKQTEQDYQATLEDMESMHQAEIIKLSMRIDEQQRALQETSALSERLKKMQRDNIDLQVANKNLQTELENVHAQFADLKQNQESEKRLHTTKYTDLYELIEQQRLEKEQVKNQNSTLESDLRSQMKIVHDLTDEIARVKSENVILVNKLDQSSHTHRMELSNQEMIHVKSKVELEQQLNQIKQTLQSQQALSNAQVG